jgi:ATP/ADP translocase
MLTGVSCVLTGGSCLQVLGWGGSALATPLVLLVAGAVFFAGSLFPAGTALPGTALAMMLALGPAAGIVAQVSHNCSLNGYLYCFADKFGLTMKLPK